MKKIFDKLTEQLPVLWGVLWMAIITIGSTVLLIWVIRWLFGALGVW